MTAALPSAEAVREKMRVPRKAFSRLTGLSERALADWESGRRITEPGLRRIDQAQRPRLPSATC
jgi:DNA-binding transcriptional regulator YiaG